MATTIVSDDALCTVLRIERNGKVKFKKVYKVLPAIENAAVASVYASNQHPVCKADCKPKLKKRNFVNFDARGKRSAKVSSHYGKATFPIHPTSCKCVACSR